MNMTQSSPVKICMSGDICGLEEGIRMMEAQLGFENSKDGLPVEVCKSSGAIKAEVANGKGLVSYERKIHFFRALGLLVEGLRDKNEFSVKEEPQLSMNGAMFDCSRNVVLKVESVKKILRTMAIMGLDMMMLYTEDTYTIKDEPYFGYMRGRYTTDELKECDAYADIFGIEMIPCIQTLAHLEQFLKWPASEKYKDSNDTLLVGSEEVYELIDKMVETVSSAFRSRRIHIGMDEAEGMGRGRYINLYGNCDRPKAFAMHLKRVVEIVKKYGLKPMMWSDMPINMASSKHDYYDLDVHITEDITEMIPEDVDFVAWDYYHIDQGFHEKFFDIHKEFKPKTIFAGGVWTWTGGYGTNYGVTFANTQAALAVCKAKGVREVFATLWLDDGGEDNLSTSLLGLQLFAELGYAEGLDEDKLKKRVKFCTGIDYDEFMSLKYIDEIPGTIPDNLDYSNPSKFLLFQDILMGLFDKHVEGLDLSTHYKKIGEKFKTYKSRDALHLYIFEVPEKLCSVLEIKSDLGIRIKRAYDKRDMDTLRWIAGTQLPELYRRVEELRRAHMEQWLNAYKPFGWEVMDIRYGGVLARINTAIKRIWDYVEGKIDRIDELDEERLSFDGLNRPVPDKGPGVFNNYKRIASANII